MLIKQVMRWKSLPYNFVLPFGQNQNDLMQHAVRGQWQQQHIDIVILALFFRAILTYVFVFHSKPLHLHRRSDKTNCTAWKKLIDISKKFLKHLSLKTSSPPIGVKTKRYFHVSPGFHDKIKVSLNLEPLFHNRGMLFQIIPRLKLISSTITYLLGWNLVLFLKKMVFWRYLSICDGLMCLSQKSKL